MSSVDFCHDPCHLPKEWPLKRRLHIEFPGAVSLVSCASRSDRAVVSSDADVLQFLSDLANVAAALDWRIHAWCILPDRYSMVVETPNGDLGRGMRRFTSTCTRHLNHQNSRSGRIFRGPPEVIVLEPQQWLLPVCRHVLLLPVTSGFALSPMDWPWSSYLRPATPPLGSGAVLCSETLLSQFGPERDQAVSAYADYMQPDAMHQDPREHATAPGLLGSQAFADEVAHHLTEHVSDPAVAPALLLLSRPSLSQLLGPEARLERSQLSRRIAAAARLGYSTTQIARHLGVHPATVGRHLRAERRRTAQGFRPEPKNSS